MRGCACGGEPVPLCICCSDAGVARDWDGTHRPSELYPPVALRCIMCSQPFWSKQRAPYVHPHCPLMRKAGTPTYACLGCGQSIGNWMSTLKHMRTCCPSLCNGEQLGPGNLQQRCRHAHERNRQAAPRVCDLERRPLHLRGKAVAVPLSEEELVAVAHTPPFMLQTRQMWAGEVRQPADVPLRSSEGRYVAGDLRSGAPPGVREMPGWVRCEVCPKRVSVESGRRGGVSEAMEAADDDESLRSSWRSAYAFWRLMARASSSERVTGCAITVGARDGAGAGRAGSDGTRRRRHRGLVALAMGGLPNSTITAPTDNSGGGGSGGGGGGDVGGGGGGVMSQWRQLQRQRRQWRRPD